MNYTRLDRTFSRDATNRIEHGGTPGFDGAVAALETFYYAFNQRNIEVFRQVWAPHALIRLNNPLGGILEGIDPITALYDGIFNGPATVWVEFHDIVVYDAGETITFAGRERGEFAKHGTVVPLDIRTSRFFHRENGRWGQVHHHGSITDTELLATYRAAVNS